MSSLPILAALLAAVILTASPLALAEERKPDPADTAAATPPLTYQSVFAGSRLGDNAPPLDWRQANDAVRETGGHGGALKDDAAPESGHAVHSHGQQHGQVQQHGGHGDHANGRRP